MWMKGLITLALSFSAVVSAQPTALHSLGVDTSRAAIPLDEILSGGPPPQGIPALGFGGDWVGAAESSPQPRFVAQAEATWLADEEPVILLTLEDESRIYPLQILTWHEVVNDTLGGVPIAVTFCPLCNSALAFGRRIPLSAEAAAWVREINPEAVFAKLPASYLDTYKQQTREAAEITQGLEVTFGVSGLLYNSNLLMFDSASSTLWSQLVGEAVVGMLTGSRLLRYPAPIVSFQEAREAFPEAQVLSRDTGFARSYGRNPYVGYDDVNSPAFLFSGVTDGRLPPKERVITFELDGETVAYPFSELESKRVVNDTVGGEPIVLFWMEGTRSALDANNIADAQDIGAATVYERQLNGRSLTFELDGDFFRDLETGSQWTLLGQAIAGELDGAQLTPVVHDNTLWFAWAAFKPETRIYGATPTP